MSAISPNTLALLCTPFDVDPATAQPVAVSQNHVFEVGPPADRAILRISQGRLRTAEEVDAELAWIDDLHNRGIPVCPARISGHGRRCERVAVDGVEYLVTLLVRAPGRKVTVADVDDDLYGELGRLAARLHAASFDTEPPARLRFVRPAWHESRLLKDDVERYVPTSQVAFRTAVQRLMEELRQDQSDVPGLVHGDISFCNAFIDNRSLTIFDFDNCEIGTVIQDLATVFYDAIYCHLLNRVLPPDLPAFFHRRCEVFLAAYRTIRPLPPLPVERLRKFLILREAIIYTHYCRILDPSSLRPAFKVGMEKMRTNVEQSVTEAEFAES